MSAFQPIDQLFQYIHSHLVTHALHILVVWVKKVGRLLDVSGFLYTPSVAHVEDLWKVCVCVRERERVRERELLLPLFQTVTS
jgi:hypothetical protein